MQNMNIRVVAISLVIVLLALGGVRFFTPFLGPARVGPMAGFSVPGGVGSMGPMSFGMMREVHVMADVESEFDFMARTIP